MNNVTIEVGDEDLKMLEEMFSKEPEFAPRVREDYVLINLMRQILKNPKTLVVQEETPSI